MGTRDTTLIYGMFIAMGDRYSDDRSRRRDAERIAEANGIDLSSHPLTREYMSQRKEVSMTLPFTEGERLNYRDSDTGARVLHQEINENTGRTELTVQTSSKHGSGTRKIVYELAGPRTLVQVDDRRGD